MTNFYNEILTDHNMHPVHKHELSCCTNSVSGNVISADKLPLSSEFSDICYICSSDGVNPSCGDEITLNLKIENGVITDGSFTGSGCAVSQASADIMLDLVIGKSVEEAKHLHELFVKMIHGDACPEEIDELEEAGALADISHMPARVKCALLGWRTMAEMVG